jgi:hypothetical protein
MKQTRVLTVFDDLALDGNDVREHVPMSDDDALRFGSGARREDDLDDVVACDRDLRHRAIRPPVDLAKAPDGNAGLI